MDEPNWRELKSRLMALTMKQLRPIGRKWFMGCLGGASTKAEYVDEMVTQMRHWWRLYESEGGHESVRGILADLERLEREVGK